MFRQNKSHIVISLIIFACIGCAMTACNESKEIKNTSKKISGKTIQSAPYELLIVANKDWLNGPYGGALMEVAKAEVPGLPQSEPNFRVTAINPTSFNKTFQVYGNIIHATIDSNLSEPEIKIAHNVYARPQIIMSISAPSNVAFAEFVKKQEEYIISTFINSELSLKEEYLKRVHNGQVATAVKKMFDCTIYVPKDISSIKEGKDFLWASSDKQDNKQNLCVYTYPYTSESTFTLDYFIQKRDSFMKENIRGYRDNQFMTTDSRTVVSRNINVDGRFVQEVRGLWKMENDMMGGPFVSYSQVDTVNHRVIVTEGFVYAPDKSKRNFIRDMEASLQTLVLPKR